MVQPTSTETCGTSRFQVTYSLAFSACTKRSTLRHHVTGSLVAGAVRDIARITSWAFPAVPVESLKLASTVDTSLALCCEVPVAQEQEPWRVISGLLHLDVEQSVCGMSPCTRDVQLQSLPRIRSLFLWKWEVRPNIALFCDWRHRDFQMHLTGKWKDYERKTQMSTSERLWKRSNTSTWISRISKYPYIDIEYQTCAGVKVQGRDFLRVSVHYDLDFAQAVTQLLIRSLDNLVSWSNDKVAEVRAKPSDEPTSYPRSCDARWKATEPSAARASMQIHWPLSVVQYDAWWYSGWASLSLGWCRREGNQMHRITHANGRCWLVIPVGQSRVYGPLIASWQEV